MARSDTSVPDRVADHEPLAHSAEHHDVDRTAIRHGGHNGGFWRHYVEMFAVMLVGMLVSGYTLVRAVGLTSWDKATSLYPTQCLLAMALGMSVPMSAWMLWRGLGRRNATEMMLVMALPVVPFLCLVWFNITTSAWCGAYCGLTAVAMLGLMLYRRGDYSVHT